MKKIIIAAMAVLLTMTMIFTLTGCGSDNKPAESAAPASEAPAATDAAPADTGAVTAADVTFTYNGTAVELNAEAEAVIAALGQYNDMSSQLSCHGGEGDDKTYSYNGFTVGTYPKDGVDRILEVVVSEAGIPTSKGVQVGDALSKVTETYGTNYKQVGMYYAYETSDGKMSLQFFIENDTVKEIDYYYNV